MKTKIIPWVMSWDGIVTKMYKVYIKEHMITPVETYLKYLVIKKTMESISFDHRRGVEDTRDQMLKLCNTVEPEEVQEETKIEHEHNKKVVM